MSPRSSQAGMKFGFLLIVLLVFGALYVGSVSFFSQYVSLTGLLNYLLSFLVSGALSFALLMGLWSWAGGAARRR